MLSSPGFARNDRLSSFLRFVVERHLEGRDSELKESVIAIEVFGRKPDYDPKLDSIVRTEAGRLRGRLVEYYAGEGRDAAVKIELPKGGYIPAFLPREAPTEHEKRRRIRPWQIALIAAGALTVAIIGWQSAHKTNPITVAVLPLENLSPDPANEYFVDGLTDEIIRGLSMIEGLAVRSRTSSFAFNDKARNVHDAGTELQVDYILEGSVLRAGQQLRVNVQLVRVRDDFPLWSGRFDRELTDIFAIQDEISRGIVNNLRLSLGRGRRRYQTSVEAYDLYLQARALERQQGVIGTISSIELFEKVTAEDPSFAPAFAGLAAAYAYRSSIHSFDEPAVVKMRAAAETAIRLDPLLAQAHEALGMVYARDGQWDQAERAFRRAIELDPGDSITYDHFALWLLMPLGRIEEAVQQARLAMEADPLSSSAHTALAFVLLSAGRYEEAAEHSQRIFRGDVMKTQLLARARLGQGKLDEAARLLEDDRKPNNGFLGYVYAKLGRREQAEKLVDAYPDRPNVQLLIYAGLGNKDRAFEALDRMAAAVGGQRVGQYLTYPELSLLEGDPRLRILRKKIGLPE